MLAAAAAPAALMALMAPAAAQITPEQAVREFTEYYEDVGYVVEVGAREAQGEVIVLSDVVLGFDLAVPENPNLTEAQRAALEDQRITVTLDGLTFAPEGEVVRVTSEPGGLLETRIYDALADVAETSVHELAIEGLSVTVAEAGPDGQDGGGEGRRYEYELGGLTSTLLKATSGGEPVEAEASFSMSGYAGRNTVLPLGEDRRSLSSDGTIERMAIDLSLPAQEEEAFPGAGTRGATTISASIEAMTATVEGTGPADMAAVMERAETDPGAFFREDIEGTMQGRFGPITVSLDQEPGTAPQDRATSLEAGYEAATLTASLGEGVIGYETTATGARFALEGGAMPVPSVEGTYDEGGFGVSMPLQQSDEARPASMSISLRGLTLSEEVWSLFDPEGALPRDPATIALALEGSVRVLEDIFVPEAQRGADPDAPPPFEFDRAALDLTLRAVGADLRAQGDFALDNADTETFAGVPAPTGTLNVEAAGIDALLDTLSQMGVVAPDQLMPARMMLGLFARADGQGGYTSTIELDGETGSVTANGQRLR